MGTVKEQSIKITASSGLSEDDIQRLVREAETHAGEDKKKQEIIEARNHDERDATCAPRPGEDFAAALGRRGLKGARLGIPKEFFGEGLAPEVRAVCQNAMRAA